MAKTEKVPSKAVTVPQQESTGLVSGEMMAMMEQDAAAQAPVGKDDLAIPFLRVAQSNSPELKKEEAKYIDNLEQGDFFNTVTKTVWTGADGIIIIPALYKRSFIEWKPRKAGGGFVKDWGESDIRLKDCHKDPETGRDMTPDGTELIRSGLFFVIIVDEELGTHEQAAFVLAGTQLKKSRAWITQMKAIMVTGPRGKFNPPYYYGAYRVTTLPEKNEKGSWYGVTIAAYKHTLELKDGERLYLAARNFARTVESGEVKVNMQETDGGSSGSSDTSDLPF